MNWTYVITGAAAEIALLTFVYHLTSRRSDATIKTLEAHKDWLEKQLDEAKEKRPISSLRLFRKEFQYLKPR